MHRYFERGLDTAWEFCNMLAQMPLSEFHDCFKELEPECCCLSSILKNHMYSEIERTYCNYISSKLVPGDVVLLSHNDYPFNSRAIILYNTTIEEHFVVIKHGEYPENFVYGWGPVVTCISKNSIKRKIGHVDISGIDRGLYHQDLERE